MGTDSASDVTCIRHDIDRSAQVGTDVSEMFNVDSKDKEAESS